MALPWTSLEKGLICRSFLWMDNSISIFTSKRPNVFQEPSVSPDTVTFRTFLGTRRVLFSLGLLSKAHFPNSEPPRLPSPIFLGFPGSSAGKEFACNVGDLGSIPGLGLVLGWEDPLEKGKATHSSIRVWRIPGTM